MIGLFWSDRVERDAVSGLLQTMNRQVIEQTRWRDERLTHCDLLAVDHTTYLDIVAEHGSLREFGPILVVDGEDASQPAVAAIRAGAVDYLPEGTDRTIIAARCAELDRTYEAQDFVAESTGASDLFRLASRVAKTDVAVMLKGESGTGKEVVARHIHAQSGRADGPFVAVNCAALPDNMLEAILFGHEKGAFTGAHESRPGKFELAHAGTLLLDEVTEMPLALQAKLLRVLQEREVERLGAKRPRSVDVRVIATSNRDLQAAIADGDFREDLYYRLNVFPLTVQPLRERSADIEPLAMHFVRKHMRLRPAGDQPGFSAAALETLRSHRWPGNVRELENAVQRALVLCDGSAIEPHHLELEMAQMDQAASDLGSKMLAAEGETILSTLRANNGRRNLTAEALGISERTLRYKLKKLKDLGMEVS